MVEKVMLTESAIKRLVEPAEVASLAAWLASPHAAMVTGASYTMDVPTGVAPEQLVSLILGPTAERLSKRWESAAEYTEVFWRHHPAFEGDWSTALEEYIAYPRGLQNEEPGLYPPNHRERLLREYSQLAHRHLEGLNHHTVVMSQRGAAALGPLGPLVHAAVDSAVRQIG